MHLKLVTPIPKIHCVVAKNQHLLASTFMRPQEFYESPYKGIRGKYFSREHYEDTYAKETGAFTYYQDWAGFNMPMECMKEFFETFHDLSKKEQKLYDLIDPLFLNNFEYVIGVTKGDTRSLDHEIAHGLWYTNHKYKTAASVLLSKLKNIKRLKKFLLRNGYETSKLDDEIQAYLSTSTWTYLKRKKMCDKKDARPFQRLFKKFTAEYNLSLS